jgi:predicted nucleic acid-binding protein
MRRVVVDAATVLSWFDGSGPGAGLRREYEAGDFAAIAPRRLPGDVLAAVAGTVSAGRLARIAAELPRIGIQLQDPPLDLLAGWLSRGLHAEVAPYAALAEHLNLPLAASDPRLRDGARSLIDD